MESKSNEEKNSNEVIEEKKANEVIEKNKKRCNKCNKKLSMINFTCKCGFTFCIKHQLPHNHNCTYNYKKDLKQKITINNPKMNKKMISVI